MKIRIFALAKELGLDSKVLIEYANDAGVKLKNSALASVSPEERDVVVDFIKKQASSGGTTTKAESLAPVRAPSPAMGRKVRTITAVKGPPRQSGLQSTMDPGDDVADGVGVMEPQDETTAPATDADAPVEAAAELDSASQTVPGSPDNSATNDATPSNGGAVRREDYVPASGTSSGGPREMKPRGTVPDSGSAPARPSRGKVKPSLPNIAAPPAYTPPKPKPQKSVDSAVQKPDIPLTADALEQHSPLKAHLQDKKKRKQTPGDSPGRRADASLKSKEGGEGVADARQQRRVRRRGRQFSQDDFGGDYQRRSPRRRRQRSSAPVALRTSAQIEPPITVRSLSEAMGRPAKDLMRILFEQGEMVTINELISEETALEIALETGVDLEIKRPRNIEEELVAARDTNETEGIGSPRPPIITILGHVDHGKTTLLDKLRSGSDDVAGSEAGGITQHIAAYQVEHNGQKLTFVDTPGHAAFAEMRARGANVTDIVVLVVAADDGVMPQTVECISHTKSAGVPVVVALNKTDLPDTNEQKVLQDLAANDLLPTEWGGEVEVVRTSGTTGQGLEDLLETLLVTAELQELKADAQRRALGVCLEAFRDEGRGALAWFLVQKGTLRIGDAVLCGPAFGRIRAIYNDRDKELEEAGPSTPVKVAGLNTVPGAGDHFFVMSDIEEARQTAESREFRGRTEVLSGLTRPRSLEDILDAARGGVAQDLPLIIKADSPGSLEALHSEIAKFEHPEVRVQFVHEGVGGVNESDIYLASASGAIVIAFHVVPEDRAQQLASSEGIDVRRYNVIYEVTETIKRALEGLLQPERVQVATGRALVLQTFHISRFGTIAGCRVLSGTIDRSNRVHLIRDQTVLNHYGIASLKREKDDAKEVREGMECGIRLEGFNDIKEGDLLEAFRVDEIKRTLD